MNATASSRSPITAPPSAIPMPVVVIIAAALVMSGAMGIRQTFGLFIGPLATDAAVDFAYAAFAIALHNLVWGFAQPLTGAAADRYGATPVVAVGSLSLAAGLAWTVLVPGPVALMLGMGVLVGFGISCTSFGVVLTAVGKAAPPERRSLAMGFASAGGSLGQALLVPLAQGATLNWGVTAALLGLAGVMVAAGLLGPLLDRRAVPASDTATTAAPIPAIGRKITARAAVGEAMRHRGFVLLTIGFFACGFQLAFIATHLPGYLGLCGMPAGMGGTALALIGLFNMAGSWGCGWLGGRFPQQLVLGWLYLIRGGAIALFVLAPKSQAGVILFAAVMGLTWLGTVPLTSGLIARLFGVGHLGALFGVCFLSHQIGSFLGAWLGGVVFDATGSLGPVWAAAVVSGVVATLLHFAITDGRGAAGPGRPEPDKSARGAPRPLPATA